MGLIMLFCYFSVLLSKGFFVTTSAEDWGKERRYQRCLTCPGCYFCAIILTWIEKKAKVPFIRI